MNNTIKYDYIIFHKNCFDGYTSFIILNKTKKIHKNAIILPDVPSAKTCPDDIENKNVIIMDVAYKYDVLKQICNVAKSVVFIDHHITIYDDVKKIKNELNDKIEIIYDEHECGSSLTWKYFNGDDELPLFVKYVKDNDIGLWKLENTHDFISALQVNFKTNLKKSTLQKWNSLFKTSNVDKLIKKGKLYSEYVNYLSTENSKRYSMEAFPSEKVYSDLSQYFNKPGEFKVAVFCGSGCPSTTLLGLKMLETIKCDFVIMWNFNLDRKEYVMAFRSKSVDVGKIASAFGGGGHKLASACSFHSSKYNISDLFFNVSLPRQSL
mgnify:CR=1 FL=1